MKWPYSYSAWTLFLWNLSLLLSKLRLTLKTLYVVDKSGYDFRIQPVKIDKEDTEYFKQWNRCRPVQLSQ
jgi:hypothetical protein